MREQGPMRRDLKIELREEIIDEIIEKIVRKQVKRTSEGKEKPDSSFGKIICSFSEYLPLS